jgi:uncharacterized membrane protein
MTNTKTQENKSKKPFIWIIGVIVVIILVIVMVKSLHTNRSLSTFKTRYLNGFMQSCQRFEGNTNTTLCTCIGNNLMTNYTDSQLMSISTEYRTSGRVPQQVANAAMICRSSK